MADLTVCIPYYGELDYLRHCLASLPATLEGLDAEVIVVDDASPVPCASMVEQEFPDVRAIVNERNRGFAGSVNVAAAHATGRALLVLNADAQLASSPAALLAWLAEQPRVGAVGPRVLNLDGTLQRQCMRGRLTMASALGYATGLDRLFPTGPLGRYLERWRDPDRPQRVAALSGACMAIRREAFDEAGGIDEAFMLYGEDLDLCYRLGDLGWRIVYTPAAEVVHAGGRGGTSRRFIRAKLYYWRALWLLLQRHARPPGFALYGWIVALALAAGFLVSSLIGLPRRRVGTAKSGADLPAQGWRRRERGRETTASARQPAAHPRL